MAAFSVSTPRARFRDLLENGSIELMFEVRRELEQDLHAAALTTHGK
jgi:hypothetical protein